MMKKTTHNTASILGIGTDIIEVQRIQEAIERHGERFLDRIFTKKEQKYCKKYNNPTPHFAGRFAAKEAVLKAFGTGLHADMSWKEIEIVNNSQGKPEVQLSARLTASLNVAHIFLSISHCEAYATSTAIVMGLGG